MVQKRKKKETKETRTHAEIEFDAADQQYAHVNQLSQKERVII
jgi:hypothetical protein